MRTEGSIPLLLALAALPALTGCYREVTYELRVRDPHQVDVRRPDGTPLLPAGFAPAEETVTEGKLWSFDGSTSYRTILRRDAGGDLTLRCEGCTGAAWSPTLLGAGGAALPVTRSSLFPQQSPLTSGPDDLALQVPVCLVPRRRGCNVRADTTLATPWTNVADLHLTRSPSKSVGTFFLVWGTVSAGIGAGALAAFPRDPRVRFGLGIPVLTMGVGALAGAIEQLAAHPIEEHPEPPHPAGP